MTTISESSLHDERTVAPCTDAKWYKRKRYYVSLLAFLGSFLAVTLRINLSIAIVQMTSSEIIINENGTYARKPEFEWNSLEKGFILSSFSWGLMFSFVGGIVTNKIGGSKTFGLGLAATATFTILTPILIRLNTTIFVAARIVEGFAESLSWASLMEIFLYWIPLHERARLSAITWSGAYAAPMGAYSLCGFLVRHYGWQASFFVTGGLSIGWFIVWWIFVPRTPFIDACISKAETEFLRQQMHISPVKNLAYPWRKILTSGPVWAFLNESFVHAWSLSFIITCLPLYVKDMRNVNIDDIGYISSIPHVCSFLGIVLSSFLVDYLRNKQIWSISNIHKILIACTQLFCIIFLTIMIIWMDFVVIIICLCLFRISYSLAEVCYNVLPNDIGQHYSSLINGLGITFLSIGYILNPIIMGYLVSNHTPAEWSRYFIFLCCFNVWGAVIFCIFGSGELQKWAVLENNALDQERWKSENGNQNISKNTIDKF